MSGEEMLTPLLLDAPAVLRVDGARGMVVRAVSGLLWITRPGSCEDTILHPGEQAALGEEDGVLIAAAKPAGIVLEVAHGVAPPRRVEWAPAEGAQGRRLTVAAVLPLPWWRRVARWWASWPVAPGEPLVAEGARAIRLRAKSRTHEEHEALSPHAVRERLYRQFPQASF